MKRVYALYRVSTAKQVDVTKDDIPMQKIACHEFSERQRDWEIIKEFEEKGISGFKVVNTAPDGFFRKNQQSPLPTAEKYDIIISSPIPPKGRQLNEQNLNRNSKLFSQRTPGNRNNRNAGQNNHKAEISYPFL